MVSVLVVPWRVREVVQFLAPCLSMREQLHHSDFMQLNAAENPARSVPDGRARYERVEGIQLLCT